MIQDRLRMDRDERLAGASPSRDIFNKTAGLVATLRKVGCGFKQDEDTALSTGEREYQDLLKTHETRLKRGYVSETLTCEGRILLEFDHHGRACLR